MAVLFIWVLNFISMGRIPYTLLVLLKADITIVFNVFFLEI